MRKEIISLLPNGAEIISLDRFGGKKDVIKVHFDNNKENETLYAYKYDNEIYLSVLKYINEKPEIIDTYQNRGCDISYISVSPLLSENDKSIIIGFKLDEYFPEGLKDKRKKQRDKNIKNKSSELAILTFSNGKLENILDYYKLIFNRIDVFDMDTKKDGICEIAIWTPDVEKALNVNIYKFVDGALEETHEYDKNYYYRVFKYYRHLVKNDPKSSVYLYHFAKAQYITGYTKEAVRSVDRALAAKHPYPSKKDLLSLKNMFEGKDL